MQSLFLDDEEDIKWLFDTALKNSDLSWLNYRSAIIFGNEDCPQKIELFRKSQPTYRTRPIAIFILNPDLTYKRVK